jgi:hypothetical protein
MDAAVHALAKAMDARVKPAHDAPEKAAAGLRSLALERNEIKLSRHAGAYRVGRRA